MKITAGSIVAEGDEHVVLVGPITGTVTLEDGSVIDVSGPAVVARDQEHADQIAHAVGLHYHENGHPLDPSYVYEHAEATSVPSTAPQPAQDAQADSAQPQDAQANPARSQTEQSSPAQTQEG